MRVLRQVHDIGTGETTEEWVEAPDVLTAAEAIAADREQRASEMRAERDRLLAASDWSMLPDVPFTDAMRGAWIAYRQALRDVTDQPGFPDAIAWPVSPSG